LEEVGFPQIRRGVMYGEVNAVVMDGRTEEADQGRGVAADVEERALAAPGEPVDDPCGLFEAMVRPTVFQVFRAPEIPLIKRVAGCVLGEDSSILFQVFHYRSRPAAHIRTSFLMPEGRMWLHARRRFFWQFMTIMRILSVDIRMNALVIGRGPS